MKYSLTILAAVLSLSAPAVSQAKDNVVGGSAFGNNSYFESMIAKGYSVKKLIGTTVTNDRDETVGKVHDLIIGSEGSMTLAIVEVDRFIGIDFKRVAVPAHLFEAGADDGIVLPGATKARLKALPTFHYAD